MKKILLFTLVSFGTLSFQANAQQTFSLTTDDTISTYVDQTSLILQESEIINTSSDSFQYHWQFLSKDLPTGWSLQGFCDNINCFPPSLWSDGQIRTSNYIQPNNNPINGLLHLQYNKPTTAGTGIVRFRVFTNDQEDTLTFILNFSPTGVSTITQKDVRVGVYPNPAVNELTVFTDKTINAKYITLFNIIGRQVMTQSINNNEVSRMNISNLAAGIYMVHITDNSGNTITTRRFTKK